MPPPSDYPARIRRLRERRGLTQAQLAALVGASYVSVNRWENAQTRPTAQAWRRLLELEAQSAPRLAEAPAPYHADEAGAVAEAELSPDQLRLLADQLPDLARAGPNLTFHLRVTLNGPPPPDLAALLRVVSPDLEFG